MAQHVSIPTKRIGDQFKAQQCNSITSAINANATILQNLSSDSIRNFSSIPGYSVTDALNNITSGSGSVTSVAMSVPSFLSIAGSPITTSGTLAVSLVSQTANKVFASPNGSSGTPIFRQIVINDISATGTPSSSTFLRGDGSWTIVSGSGSVTSVALSLPSFITVSGSPVTTSGTLTGTLATQSANRIFSGPTSGSAAAPTFRALVAADIPSLSYVTSVTLSTGTTGLTGGSTITSSGTWTLAGTLNIANGGTGQTTASAAFDALAPSQTSNSGKFLTTNGTTTSWATISGTGTVTSIAMSGGTTGLTYSGSPVTTSGTITLSGTLAIANGGTGQTTANDSLNALLPSQTGNNGKVLQTDGTNSSWQTISTSVENLSDTLIAGNTTGANDIIIDSGQKITSATNTNLVLQANGSGKVAIGDATLLFPDVDGTNGQVLKTNGSGGLSWVNGGILTDTYIGFGNASNVVSGSSNLIYDYSTNSTYFKNGNYLIGDADPLTVDISHGRLRINGGTKVTGDSGASFVLAQTWNDATMIGFLHTTNVTDTASDDNSYLQHYNVNTFNVWAVRKDGAWNAGANSLFPWADGIGVMEAMFKATTPPTSAAATNSAIRWFDDTSKRYKYIDDTAAVMTIATTADLTSGTVTSVALSLPSFITVSGSPVTTSGTLTGTLASQSQNLVFASPNGSSGTPTFRSLVAADIPSLSYVTSINVSGGTTGLTTSGGPITTSGTITLNGTLAIANGGTGQTTANDALNALIPSQTSNSGKFLTTNGTDTSWATISGTGTVTSIDISGGTTGLTTTGGPITTSGSITLTGTLNIANGGTGATTANNALNALLPSQTSNSGKVLQTDGTNSSWVTSSSLLPSQTGNSGKFLTTDGSNPSWANTTYGVRSVNAQVGTTFTPSSSDSGQIVTLNNALAITVTLSNLTAGSETIFIQLGAGQVTFATGTLTLRHVASLTKIAGQYGSVIITVVSTNAVLSGDVA